MSIYSISAIFEGWGAWNGRNKFRGLAHLSSVSTAGPMNSLHSCTWRHPTGRYRPCGPALHGGHAARHSFVRLPLVASLHGACRDRTRPAAPSPQLEALILVFGLWLVIARGGGQGYHRAWAGQPRQSKQRSYLKS